MALNIRNPETERLASEVARRTGETKTEAVTQALRERLARLRRGRSKQRLADELEAIAEHCAGLPDPHYDSDRERSGVISVDRAALSLLVQPNRRLNVSVLPDDTVCLEYPE